MTDQLLNWQSTCKERKGLKPPTRSCWSKWKAILCLHVRRRMSWPVAGLISIWQLMGASYEKAVVYAPLIPICRFPEMGAPPNHPFVHRMLPYYRPSIVGYHHLWKPPFIGPRCSSWFLSPLCWLSKQPWLHGIPYAPIQWIGFLGKIWKPKTMGFSLEKSLSFSLSICLMVSIECMMNSKHIRSNIETVFWYVVLFKINMLLKKKCSHQSIDQFFGATPGRVDLPGSHLSHWRLLRRKGESEIREWWFLKNTGRILG